ncbi:hypothetical protein N431DRAFT_524153 [Stipitochalara longipes BDJ]|nr:hypothetical protein N431DRAFT_524153 [Stipitochalara longipes BDJ]
MKFSILVVPLYVGISGTTVGTCELTSWCSDNSGYDGISNLCPHDPDNVKCCFSPTCYHGIGSCEDTETYFSCGKLGGRYIAGYCPGPADYQCCVPNGT